MWKMKRTSKKKRVHMRAVSHFLPPFCKSGGGNGKLFLVLSSIIKIRLEAKRLLPDNSPVGERPTFFVKMENKTLIFF